MEKLYSVAVASFKKKHFKEANSFRNKKICQGKKALKELPHTGSNLHVWSEHNIMSNTETWHCKTYFNSQGHKNILMLRCKKMAGFRQGKHAETKKEIYF